jgi:hypothetical protein
VTALSAIVTRIAAAPRWPSCAWFASRITGWGWSSSFSAWGVTGIIFGILLVCRWSRWYVLVFVGLRWSSLALLVFAETHQTLKCGLLCRRRCVTSKASSELRLRPLPRLKIFLMPGALRPDGRQGSYRGQSQKGDPDWRSSETGLSEALAGSGGTFHPMPAGLRNSA